MGTALPVVLVILILVVPSSTRQRLTAFTTGDKATEASASSESREYLLKQSIIYTFQHPIFGVGPGQFTDYENQRRKNQGLRRAWHRTHNSYTQISSECGIPAFLFYLAAVTSTFRLLGRIRRRAKAYRQKEILAATFCITLGLVGYSSAGLFVNFGYFFYFPAISGLVLGIWYAVCHDPKFGESTALFDKTRWLPPTSVPLPCLIRRHGPRSHGRYLDKQVTAYRSFQAAPICIPLRVLFREFFLFSFQLRRQITP